MENVNVHFFIYFPGEIFLGCPIFRKEAKFNENGELCRIFIIINEKEISPKRHDLP